MNPFKITVYDRLMKRKGWIGAPLSCTFTPRFNAQGTGQIVLSPDDRMMKHLLTEGARVTVAYRGVHLMSGGIGTIGGSVLPNRPVTFQVVDDWRLTSSLAYINPAEDAAATSLTDVAQAIQHGSGPVAGKVWGQTGYYPWPTVTSREAAVKAIMGDNLRDRLGVNIDIMPDLGRGGSPTRLPQVRMQTLAEAVQPVLRDGDLGMRIMQPEDGDRLQLDVWAPRRYPRKLTARSGVLVDGDWQLNPPTVTRTTGGGPGEQAARAFATLIDAELEARYGTVMERFRDATNVKMEWGELAESDRVPKYYPLRPEIAQADRDAFVDAMLDAMTGVLDDGRPTSSLSVELSETPAFRFGGARGVQLGDWMTIEAQGMRFTEQITEATVTLSADGKVKATPRVGERKDDPTVSLAKAIGKLAASQRRSLSQR